MKRTSSILGSLVDQTSSILAGFVFTVLVARVATPEEFGAYALALSIVGFSIGLIRATLGTDLLVSEDMDEFHESRLRASFLTSVLIVGVLVAIGMMATSVALPQLVGQMFLACALISVPESASAALRLINYRAGMPDQAARVSGFILLASLVVGAGLYLSASETLLALVLGQAAASFLGVSLYAVTAMEVPRLSNPRTILAHGRSLWRGLVASYMAGQGLRWAVPSIVAVASSLAATAAVRGAQTIVNLGASVYLGLGPLATRSAAQRLGRSGRVGPVPIAWFGGSAVVGFGMWLVAMSVPPEVGKAVLGETWSVAQPLIGWLSLAFIGNQLAFSGAIVLQTARRTDRLAVSRFLGGVSTAALVFAGAWLGDELGASIALAAGSWFGGLIVLAAVKMAGLRCS